MRRRVLLSPAQSASFAMGRTLLVFESWAQQVASPIELERAMLVDFAVQYPRSIGALVPALPSIVRAYGIDQGDLGDLFAIRRFSTIREFFSSTVALLISRRLVDELPRTETRTSTMLALSSSGREAAQRFTTPLALAIRSLSDAVCLSWRRRNTEDLRRALGDSLPNTARDVAELMRPVRLSEEDA
jgi:hypothetical protein